MAGYFKTMSDGTPVNKEKVKAIQSAMGILSDGLLGEHTLDRIYRAYAQPQDAYSDFFYNATVITGRPENAFTSLQRSLSDNSISGTFQWKGNVVSPLVVDGKLINGNSAHAHKDNPDTVLYFDGEVKEERTIYFDRPCKWAIGGVGLHNWNPQLEGYYGVYGDVLRNTYHTMVGVYPDGYMVLVYAKGTGDSMRKLMMDRLKCKYAIMLDGGHIAAVKCDKHHKNVSQAQSNIIGFRR